MLSSKKPIFYGNKSFFKLRFQLSDYTYDYMDKTVRKKSIQLLRTFREEEIFEMNQFVMSNFVHKINNFIN